MQKIKNNQGLQTETVKSWLVYYIKEHGLKKGDRLPSQAEIREALDVGSVTIQRALKALAAAEIVTIRKNRGVFLNKTDLDGFFGRKIGIVCTRLPGSVSKSIFLQNLQIALHDQGVQIINFLRDDSPMSEQDSISMFSGLERLISQKAVDGLILMVPMDEAFISFCERMEIPWCYYGDRDYYKFSVMSIVHNQDSIERLQKNGCKRPAVFLSSAPDRKIRDTFSVPLKKIYGDSWEKYIFSLQLNDNDAYNHDQYLQKIAELARNYRKFPESERPDGVYIPDDFFASAFALNLSQCGAAIPKMIVLRQKQVPVCLPESVVGIYEEDLSSAAKAVSDLMFRLLRKENEPDRICIIYKRPYTAR